MKLLVLLALWGVVSVTSVQAEWREHYTILDDEADRADVNVTEIEAMQASEDRTTNPSLVLRTMQKGNITSMRSDLGRENVANMFHSNQTEAAMFRTSSGGTNEEVNVTTSSASSTSSTQQTFHCPYKKYRLRWFPHNIGSVRHICFVPWAWNQNIVYAKCINRNCHRSSNNNNNNDGCCRPACHYRHVIAALCFSPQSSGWTWRVLVRYLPHACVCSSCFSFQHYKLTQSQN